MGRHSASRGRVATLPRVTLPEGSRQEARPERRPPVKRTRKERRQRRRTIRLARRTVFGRHPTRTAVLVILLAMTPIWISLGSALTDPGLGSSLSSRGAEWVRSNGGSSVVGWIENFWYSHHQPPVGGTPLKGAIPPPPSSTTPTATTGGVAHLVPPAALKPFASPPILGEGVWHTAGRTVGGLSAIYETYLRPDPVHTSLVVGVAWMDTKLLKMTLYSGSSIPGGGPYPYTAPIQPSAASTVVAAFNAGFRMKDANGGYYTNKKMILPLRVGAASLVIYKDGTATVGQWGRDVKMSSNVVAVRQNLDLLVDNGKPVPGLSLNNPTKWGLTVGNSLFVWRSGIGVTADGALVYVGGPGLDATTLAKVLARAGAVRAMELDINTDWVNFATFAPGPVPAQATTANGTELLSTMSGSPGRYFANWWTRDFFTMSARSVGK